VGIVLLALLGACSSADPAEDSRVDGARPGRSAEQTERQGSDGGSPQPGAGLTLTASECEELRLLVEAGPSQPPIPGRIDDAAKAQILAELDAAVAAAPEETREAMASFAAAYRSVLDELAGLQVGGGEPDRQRLARINEIMAEPEVVAAMEDIKVWLEAC
jgi:hypothetical protein